MAKDVLQEYLVSVGYQVNRSELNEVLYTINTLDHMVGKVMGSFGSTASKASKALLGTLATTTSVISGFTLAVAQSDIEIEKWARRMWMTEDYARSLQFALSAMGATWADIEDIAANEELNARFRRLMGAIDDTKAPESLQGMLKDFRMMWEEVQRFKALLANITQWTAWAFLDNMGEEIQDLRFWLDELNDKISDNMENIGKKIAKVLELIVRAFISAVSLIKSAWSVIKPIFDTVMGFVLGKFNLVGGALFGWDEDDSPVEKLEKVILKFQEWTSVVNSWVDGVFLPKLEKTLEWLEKVFSNISTGFKQVMDSAAEELKSAWSAIQPKISEYLNRTKQDWEGFFTGFTAGGSIPGVDKFMERWNEYTEKDMWQTPKALEGLAKAFDETFGSSTPGASTGWGLLAADTINSVVDLIFAVITLLDTLISWIIRIAALIIRILDPILEMVGYLYFIREVIREVLLHPIASMTGTNEALNDLLDSYDKQFDDKFGTESKDSGYTVDPTTDRASGSVSSHGGSTSEEEKDSTRWPTLETDNPILGLLYNRWNLIANSQNDMKDAQGEMDRMFYGRMGLDSEEIEKRVTENQNHTELTKSITDMISAMGENLSKMGMNYGPIVAASDFPLVLPTPDLSPSETGGRGGGRGRAATTGPTGKSGNTNVNTKITIQGNADETVIKKAVNQMLKNFEWGG
jgi:hypothetical protein